jgi:uncharacterized lipoprotein YehR (DUF1307 family)
MNRFTTCCLPLAAMVLVLSGCKDKLTSDNYDAIQMGVAMHEVEAILGPGEKQEISGVSISGAGVASSGSNNSQQTYIWKSNGKEIAIIFQDGKVVNKNKAGL